MDSLHRLKTSSLKYIAAISEKVGQLKYIITKNPNIDFNKKCLIKSLQTRLGNSNDQKCLRMIQNPETVSEYSEKGTDKNLIEAYAYIYNRLSKEERFSIEDFSILFQTLIEEECRIFSKSNDKLSIQNIENEFYLYEIIKLVFDTYNSYPDNRLFNGLIELWMMLSFYNEHTTLFYLPFQQIILSDKKYLEIANMEAGRLQLAKRRGEGQSETYSPQFRTFLLEVINLCMEECVLFYEKLIHPKDRISTVRTLFNGRNFSRKEYMDYYKDISAPTASRDLTKAVEEGILEKRGDKNKTRYRFRDTVRT